MLGADLVAGRIEIDEVAAADIDGADAEPHLAVIDAIKIDEPLERAAQRRRVVPAGGLDSAGRRKIGRRDSRLEEARSALEQGRSRPQSIEENVTEVCQWCAIPKGSNRSCVVTCSQKARSLSSRASGALPAIK